MALGGFGRCRFGAFSGNLSPARSAKLRVVEFIDSPEKPPDTRPYRVGNSWARRLILATRKLNSPELLASSIDAWRRISATGVLNLVRSRWRLGYVSDSRAKLRFVRIGSV